MIGKKRSDENRFLKYEIELLNEYFCYYEKTSTTYQNLVNIKSLILINTSVPMHGLNCCTIEIIILV